jgi:hypothetical protein
VAGGRHADAADGPEEERAAERHQPAHESAAVGQVEAGAA